MDTKRQKSRGKIFRRKEKNHEGAVFQDERVCCGLSEDMVVPPGRHVGETEPASPFL